MTTRGEGDVAEKFRVAAIAYLLYGVVYWIGGVYLAFHGVGVRGSAGRAGIAWIVLGSVFALLIPYLLHRPRGWFERWILSRRDFARILSMFLAVRAWKVGQIALREEGGAVPLPWAGTITFQTGGALFFVITVVALGCCARAAWTRA
jgi:hypothetical protein